LLELNNIKKYFIVEKSIIERILGSSTEAVHAVDNITLRIKENEIFGLCGESGCGKSTTARVISGLDFETDGEFVWRGEVKEIPERKQFSFRKNIQLIFQNPFQSLHPRMTVGSQVAHALEIQMDHPERDKYLNFAKFGAYFTLFIFALAFLELIVANIFELMTYLNETFGNVLIIGPLTLKPELEFFAYLTAFFAIISFLLLNYIPKVRLYYKILGSLENRTKAKMLFRADLGRKMFGISIFIAIVFLLLGLETTHLFVLNLIVVNYEFIYPGVILIDISIFFIAFGILSYLLLTYLSQRLYLDGSVIDIFKAVGLTPAPDYYLKYPHQLSGGERQRVAVARALILNPKLVIADEPTSMLDVSIRASILDLIGDLKNRFKLSVLFITHDLATVRYFCDKVAIMYVGEIVEIGTIKAVYESPRHPYTWSLIQAIPVPDPNYKLEGELPSGEVPDAINPPTGCRFHPRCPFAKEKCAVEVPTLYNVSKDHSVACHFHEELFMDKKLKI
jgi:oligopeptide/dipeptide ABC transporter ATP-binding protein